MYLNVRVYLLFPMNKKIYIPFNMLRNRSIPQNLCDVVRLGEGWDLTTVSSKVRRELGLESRVASLGKPRPPGVGALGQDSWIA